jgi:nitroimidazol reductase NimA-like FMN-containing flavoprotein (pyridoxamine 5'-phosphate oxidase superfamily)
MLESIQEIIRTNNLAVLATCAENQPHCSLMAYISLEEQELIYMLTQKDSRKFRNISANPKVSLMVDTRLDNPEKRTSIKALTINGTCRPAEQTGQNHLKDLLLKRHPQLKALTDHQDAVVIEIKAESFLLLDGVNNAFFMDIST